MARSSAMVPGFLRSAALAGLCCTLFGWALLGCAAERSQARVRIEALFDVPREYRILSTLPCADGAALVYLVSAEGDLYSFEPETLQFKRIGRLGCPAHRRSSPNSMAVDRSGTAWLSYTDGTLYKASTRDASCSATSFDVGQHGFGNFGMAFVSTGKDLSDETLFIWGGHQWGQSGEGFGGWRGGSRDWRGQWLDFPEHEPGDGPDGFGLAWIDRSTLAMTPIGGARPPLGLLRADLTGTGDGRLFGFFATHPAVLSEIDVRTGATRDPQRLEGITTGSAWAFSAWGGAFWLYWAPHGRTSRVTRLDADGRATDVLLDIGFRIVGAGVSTCAPTTAGRSASGQ